MNAENADVFNADSCVVPIPYLIQTHVPVFDYGELNCFSRFLESIAKFLKEIEICQNQLLMCKNYGFCTVIQGLGTACNGDMTDKLIRLNTAIKTLVEDGVVAVKDEKNIDSWEDLLCVTKPPIQTSNEYLISWLNFQMIMECREEYIQDFKSKFAKIDSDWKKIQKRLPGGMHKDLKNVPKHMRILEKHVADVTNKYTSYDPDMNRVEACLTDMKNLQDQLVVTRKEFKKVLEPFNVIELSDDESCEASD